MKTNNTPKWEEEKNIIQRKTKKKQNLNGIKNTIEKINKNWINKQTKDIKERSRCCPNCKNILTYLTKYHKIRAEKDNCVCKSCSKSGSRHHMYGKPSSFKNRKHTLESKQKISKNHADVSGKNNPMYGSNGGMFGKKHSIDSKEKIREGNRGKIVSEDARKKISKSRVEFYKNNPGFQKGRKMSDESRRKMRIAKIKNIKIKKVENKQYYPSYNSKTIPLIEQYGKEHGYVFKHAENGGEFFIKHLGYWVDGYDVNKNIVFEYYEKHHKYTKERDLRRMNEIINYLKCTYIIMYENTKIKIHNFKNR